MVVEVSMAVLIFDKLLSYEVVLLLRRHSCVLVEFVCIIHLTAIAHIIDPMFDLCPDIKKSRERSSFWISLDTALRHLFVVV